MPVDLGRYDIREILQDANIFSVEFVVEPHETRVFLKQSGWDMR